MLDCFFEVNDKSTTFDVIRNLGILCPKQKLFEEARLKVDCIWRGKPNEINFNSKSSKNLWFLKEFGEELSKLKAWKPTFADSTR